MLRIVFFALDLNTLVITKLLLLLPILLLLLPILLPLLPILLLLLPILLLLLPILLLLSLWVTMELLWTLMVPVFVIEELVKQRLRSIVTTQVRTLARPCFRFFALHVTAASCLMAGAKLLLKGAARKRGRRTYSTLCFITDIALPTSFYGPALEPANP
ncbi:hypothetical protein HaLaN_02852 [Haematococcus lacustris]|uniref:Uncharacterized protein n=1 Tax=Haematococcus lacustris TaxID=44745 RepID=A0A699YD55_HAELA|nr:hypothetical protein HaLaN_02852 [Haematococcus lacustris]